MQSFFCNAHGTKYMRSYSLRSTISAAALFASTLVSANPVLRAAEEKPGTAEESRVAAAESEKENERKELDGDSGLSSILSRPLSSAPAAPQPPSRIRLLSPEEILKNRSHEIVLDADGAFVGRIFSITAEGLAPAPGMQVKLLTHGGLVAETMTDSTGRFSVSGLKRDVGGVVAIGPAGMVVYGVRMVEATPEQPADKEIDVESAAVLAADSALAQKLMKSAIGVRDMRFNTKLLVSDEEFPYGEGNIATSLSYDSVQIAADGKVYGQVNLLDERTGRYREVLSMKVYFLKDGEAVGTARVAPNGSFAVAGLAPGVHSLVGVGRDGVFGMGIEVLPFKAAAAGDYVPVSMFLTTEVAVAPIGAQNLNQANFDSYFGADSGAGEATDAVAATAAAAPAAPTGSGVAGTSGGGGGGASGAGLAAGIAGGGLGAVLGAASDSGLSGGGFSNNCPPTTPSQ